MSLQGSKENGSSSSSSRRADWFALSLLYVKTHCCFAGRARDQRALPLPMTARNAYGVPLPTPLGMCDLRPQVDSVGRNDVAEPRVLLTLTTCTTRLCVTRLFLAQLRGAKRKMDVGSDSAFDFDLGAKKAGAAEGDSKRTGNGTEGAESR